MTEISDLSLFSAATTPEAIALFDLLPVGVCMVNADGVFIGANTYFCRYVGYTVDELLQMRVSDITHPEDSARDTAALRQLMDGDSGVYSVEKRYIRKDGQLLWISLSTTTVRDPSGKPLHAIAVVRDIADRKRAEEALRREAERTRQMLDSIDEGCIMMDKDFRILQINAEGLRIDGRPASEILGRTHWEAWPGSKELPLGQAYIKSMRERSPVAMEQHYVHLGQEIWVDTRAFPTGEGLVVFYRDITERKRTAQALQESEAQFRTIANAMPQMVWSTLPDGYHDYYNQQWYDFTGVPEGSTDGEEWNGMFHPEDQPRAWEKWRHSLATGEPYEIQYRLRHRSGQYRWTLGRALPVRDEEGKVIRWMGTCTDIHEQKQAEEQLKAANRRKDEFLAMLAHELRNPLAPISTAAQLLKLVGGDEKRVQESSDIIDRQVKHMTDLVNDLLDVSRVTRGLVTLEKEDLDLKPVINNAIEQAQPLIEARHHVLNTRVSGEHAFVRGDRTRLVQVIANLLNNAAKYTPIGGEIQLSLRVRENEATISVSDNGAGIESSLLPHVFDLFTQAERTPDRSQGGLGLGLALVKSIMALHEGRVEAHSDGLGKGSIFTISLPLLNVDTPDHDRHQRTATARATVKPSHVMIVDDNLDAANSLGTLLEAQGHHVTVRNTAHSALHEAGMNPASVFILDIGLPDMDGYALARQLRARPETAKGILIALTGYGQAHDRVRSKAAGFDYHFVKPVDTDELAAILAQAG